MIELNIRNVTRARLRLDHSLEPKKSTLSSGHEPEAEIKQKLFLDFIQNYTENPLKKGDVNHT